ncbi:unnamed protein product [Oreochromis niloticus]|nr:unnamed protein product [Mustela putorius furo]
MKDGDVSLVQKNVSFGVDGTCKCRVIMRRTYWIKYIINLVVVPPGEI